MSNFLTGTSNADYHADRTHLSSSGLKLLLTDPAQFYKEYILGERVVRESAAFTEGTLVHMLILEPHLVESSYAVYPGARRAGKAYETWLMNVPEGKTVVTYPQMERCKELAQACFADPEAMATLTDGEAEHSMTGTFRQIPVKARADFISVKRRYIVDVKTTSKPTGAFTESVEQFYYDLSAALYASIAEDNYEGQFDFIWIVISKADKGVEVIRASSEDMRIGMAKLERAVAIYNHCKQTGVWALPDVTQGEKRVSKTAKTKKGTELQLISLKGKNYMQVAQRLVWINDDVNRFVIETEFPLLTEDQTVCKARVMLLSDIGEAMKTATATKREHKSHFADHTEKAETGAIGRALALLGFGTQFAEADLDEGDRIVDSPIAAPAPKAAKPRVVKSADKASGDDFE
ncbi:Putative exodeoxyribonuclease 8, PDDEXK-like domain containing protein [uncultured Caudovirales phage]|uniref:Exodeoxyribonuclease 8, PDDEXK-like domain containing protein n=1 Tax=uncultured Caudovirales phage TaxID=2100421 RepID=A0A6J5S1P5_9CAUD|nr:Putative exodeoxyribonuclease 8, PDDEXK-like domain containing protein [uncultured Caudovirales phage]